MVETGSSSGAMDDEDVSVVGGNDLQDGLSANKDASNSNKTEMVRLIIQSLQHLGYGRTASFLEKDSGILLQAPEVTNFCKSVMEGKWDQVDTLLPCLAIRREADISAVKFHIYSQKFLELLESRKVKEALHTLRYELTPLNQSPEKLHRLASLVMCSDLDDLRKKADWPGCSPSSRRAVLTAVRSYVSANVMLPEHRLAELLQQAVKYQTSQCLYHNEATSHISLFSDHSCDRRHIPSETVHILDKHTDEVWFVRFSHSGRILASTGKDGNIILWDVLSPSFSFIRALTGHSMHVSYLAFSPDDTLLLSCSEDSTMRLWNTEDGTCVRSFKHHVEPVTACSWLPDGKSFVSGGNDKNVYVVSIDGHVISKFNVARVNDLIVSHDGTRVIIVCQEKKIRIRSLVDRTESESVIQEADSVTSLALSADSRYLLVNISSNSTETHLWDLTTKRLVQKYRGQKQGRFVIRSCFGGFGEAFVLSGSEGPSDCNVYIWHREHGNLLSTLMGHTRSVNCVAWNPANPDMIASASDDCTIRIWVCPPHRPTSPTSNGLGVHSHSNGNNNNNNNNNNVTENGKAP